MYHFHIIYSNISLWTNDSTTHSPIIGFARDGYPIYGPYGYSNATDSKSSIVRMKTCYYQRTYPTGVRTTLFDGTEVDTENQLEVNSTYPLGSMMDDWGCDTTNSDLDITNSRYCVTPEYPNGTYAYFLPTDTSGTSAYPLILGLYYRGTPSKFVFYSNYSSTNRSSVYNAFGTTKTTLCS